MKDSQRNQLGDCFDCDYYPVNLEETLCARHADLLFDALEEVFLIAENTAILKYKIYQMDVPLITIPPTVIKKFYTTKGNATKEHMMDMARAYKIDVATEDEADAILLFHLAKKDLEL